MRIGIGYDVHRLAEKRNLILGGVRIPFKRGLLGHSDADVLLHAIMDAILGAAALGDIGKLFPDTDNRYFNISSLELLKDVNNLIYQQGQVLHNLDSVIVAQKPKLRDYLPEMRKNLAAALQVDIDQVSVKATTTENLGYIGREEGIAAQAVVLLKNQTARLPGQEDTCQRKGV